MPPRLAPGLPVCPACGWPIRAGQASVARPHVHFHSLCWDEVRPDRGRPPCRWWPIPGHPGYEANAAGQVRSYWQGRARTGLAAPPKPMRASQPHPGVYGYRLRSGVGTQQWVSVKSVRTFVAEMEASHAKGARA